MKMTIYDHQSQAAQDKYCVSTQDMVRKNLNQYYTNELPRSLIIHVLRYFIQKMN